MEYIKNKLKYDTLAKNEWLWEVKRWRRKGEMKDMVVNKRVSWGSERVELEKDMRDERSGKRDAHFYVFFLFY